MKHPAFYPGPYEVRGNGDEEQFTVVTSDGLHEVAVVNGFEDGDPRNAVRLANATLLAAAPDLLAVLKAARDRMFGSGPAMETLRAQADAAIAKATATAA